MRGTGASDLYTYAPKMRKILKNNRGLTGAPDQRIEITRVASAAPPAVKGEGWAARSETQL